MNKTEACKYLEVSERSLARYAAQGKIGVSYLKGKRGNIAEYDDEDLQRLKNEISKPISTRPVVERLHDNTANSDMTLAKIDNVSDLLSFIADRLAPVAQPLVSIAQKLMLSISEASALTGLSRAELREAIRKKKLHAIRRRGFKIKRTDLDNFIRKL